MPHDSSLQFRSVNHDNPDTFNTELAFPKLPAKPTPRGHRESDAIDPNVW